VASLPRRRLLSTSIVDLGCVVVVVFAPLHLKRSTFPPRDKCVISAVPLQRRQKAKDVPRRIARDNSRDFVQSTDFRQDRCWISWEKA
jgi:hypothetical protein